MKKEEKIEITMIDSTFTNITQYNIWSNTERKIDLKKSLKRNILFEKHVLKKKIEIEVIEYFIYRIDKCELYLNSQYPNSIFYIKKIELLRPEILMRIDKDYKTIYVKHYGFWDVIEEKYKLNYDEVQMLFNKMFEYVLELQDYKSYWSNRLKWIEFENTIKL